MLQKLIKGLGIVLLGIGLILLIIPVVTKMKIHYSKINQLTYQYENDDVLIFKNTSEIFTQSGFIESYFVEVMAEFQSDDNAKYEHVLDNRWGLNLNIPGVEIHPDGVILLSVNDLVQRKITWNLISDRIGRFEGTLWIYRFDAQDQATPVFAVPVTVENQGFLGISYHKISGAGFTFAVAGILCLVIYMLLKLTRLKK